MLTDKRTDKRTDGQWQKHYNLGGGSNDNDDDDDGSGGDNDEKIIMILVLVLLFFGLRCPRESQDKKYTKLQKCEIIIGPYHTVITRQTDMQQDSIETLHQTDSL